MAASTATNIGLQYAWALGEDGWNTGMDSNLLKLDSLVQPNVIDSTLTTPPGSPTTGDKYIVATGSGGAWAGLDNKIVVYANSTWISYTPQEGWIVYDQTNNYYLKFNGSAWVQDPLGDRAYAESLVTGLWDDRGNFDASVNAYPSSGGSGAAGAIMKGDIWTISVAGTLPTAQAVEVGDTVRALQDTPGNTQANWAIAQNNIGYVPESSANKSTDGTMADNSATKYPSQSAVVTYVGNQVSTAGNNYALKEEWFEDFIVANDTTGNWLNTLQSRDTSINISIPTSAPIGSIAGASNTMGWCVLYNSSLASGAVSFLLRESFGTTNHVPADCKKEAIFGVSIETLPTNTSTTDGVLRYGLFSYTTVSTTDPVGQSTASAYFQADKDGFWKCFSGKTGVNENTTTAVALAADTYVALNVLIASNGAVTFYINGTLVATHSTGVCNYAQPFTAGYSIYNQGAGTLASSATGVGATAFDYWGTKYTLSSARTNAVFKG